jgi:hypothetical protein
MSGRRMSTYTRAAAAVAAAGLAAGLAACSSSGGGKADSNKPVAQLASLSGQSTTVALDTGFVKAISSLKLTPGLIGSAKLNVFDLTFPVTGGHVTVYPSGHKPVAQGLIEHATSGVSFTGTGVKIGLKNLVVRLGTTSTLTGEVDVNNQVVLKSATLFDLDESTATAPSVKNGVTTLAGGTVYLDAGAAKSLDGILKTKVLEQAGKIKIGIATIKATGN